MLISTMASVLDMSFRRIQFTPDLMPGDITGTEILEEDYTTGKRIFRFVEGPLFGNMILADEINRFGSYQRGHPAGAVLTRWLRLAARRSLIGCRNTRRRLSFSGPSLAGGCRLPCVRRSEGLDAGVDEAGVDVVADKAQPGVDGGGEEQLGVLGVRVD